MSTDLEIIRGMLDRRNFSYKEVFNGQHFILFTDTACFVFSGGFQWLIGLSMVHKDEQQQHVPAPEPEIPFNGAQPQVPTWFKFKE